MKKGIVASLVVTGLLVAGTASAQSAEELLKSKGCLGCHDVEKKKVGPSLKAIADTHKADAGAATKIAAALKGGKATGGKPHPGKVSGVSDAELKTMLEYVLSRK